MELPSSWAEAELADIGKAITGNTPPTKDINNYGSYIPFIKPPELNDEKINSAKSFLSEQGAKTARVLSPYSILVSCIGNLGKTGFNKIPVAFNQQINAIEPFTGIIPEYLFYQAQSYSFRSQLESKATATTISIVNKSSFEKFTVNIAPLPEQNRIVAKIEALFSELDKGIESFKTAREQLKIYRQGLLKHAFSGKLTAQWRSENQDKLETAEALLQRIQTEREQRYQQQLKDWENKSPSIPLLQRGKPVRATIQTTTQSIVPPFEKGGLGGISKPKPLKILPPLTAEELAELPELPEGWTWVKSGELFESVTSGSRGWAEYYADSGAIFIRITNLDFDSLKLDLSPKKIQYVQPPAGAEGLRTKVKEGDFLFSITGYLGMFAIAPSLDDAYVNQHISLARPLDGFSKKYFGYYVTSHTGGIHHLNKQTKGAVKAGLGLDDIQNFPVPMCSLNEQINISCELESRLSEVDQLDQTLTTALRQAEALRQSILKKAFSGQLVPQDPNDEPAGVLLERIKNSRQDAKAQRF